MKFSFSRREFLHASALGGLAWAAESSRLAVAADSSKSIHARELKELKGASLDRKAELVQEIYENVAFHESGILYSMMRLDAEGIRPFVAGDFAGKIGLNVDVG